MTLSDEQAAQLLELSDRAAINDVLMKYVRGVDRRDWELVRSCYHDDAYQDHGAYAGDVDGLMAWSADWHKQIPVCMHTVSNVLIEVVGRKAVAESYVIVHQMQADETGELVYGTAGCRYVDTFEDRPGIGWRIVKRIVPLVFTRPPDAAGDQPAITGALESRRDDTDSIYVARAEAGIR
jgi:3-phenylpropionate/cinnamic acid dioxygenase small subunit